MVERAGVRDQLDSMRRVLAEVDATLGPLPQVAPEPRRWNVSERRRVLARIVRYPCW